MTIHIYPTNPPGLDFTAWNLGDAVFAALCRAQANTRANLGAQLSHVAARAARLEQELAAREREDDGKLPRA